MTSASLPNNGPPPASELLRLLERRVELLTAVCDLTRRQRECVVAKDVDGLLRVLSDKQRLIAGVQENELRLRPHSTVDPEQRRWASDAEKQRAAEASAAATALRDEAVLIEREAEAMLLEQRDVAAATLRSSAASAAAARAYARQD